MLDLDRVICNCCGGDMGQLHHQPAAQADLLPDLRTAPYFAVCPVCEDSAIVFAPAPVAAE